MQCFSLQTEEVLQLVLVSTRGSPSLEQRKLKLERLFWKVQWHHLWFHLEVLAETENCISAEANLVAKNENTSLKSWLYGCCRKWKLTPRSQSQWWSTELGSMPTVPKESETPVENKHQRHEDSFTFWFNFSLRKIEYWGVKSKEKLNYNGTIIIFILVFHC